MMPTSPYHGNLEILCFVLFVAIVPWFFILFIYFSILLLLF